MEITAGRGRRWRLMGPFLLAVLLVFSGLIKDQALGLRTSLDYPQPNIERRTIHLDLPEEDQGMGGLITADVDDDGVRDFIVTRADRIVAVAQTGEQLWALNLALQVTLKSEDNGLPGWHGPGVQAADVDGDGQTEVLFLTRDGILHLVEGATGRTKHSFSLPSPAGTDRWEHLVVASFRGEGDRDILLQATNKRGYRAGYHLAAWAVDSLIAGNSSPLWQRNDFQPAAHSGARVADLDGDGRDEVLGGAIISPQGQELFRLPLPDRIDGDNHVDAVMVADLRPDLPGLEVIILEEGGDEAVFALGREGVVWESHHFHQEPQNAAVGDFAPGRDGLEVWCRSRYDEHQKPFVFDAQGRLIADQEMDKLAPPGWTQAGVEEIFKIDWTGGPQELAAAKERHESGDVAVFDPVGGQFLLHLDEEADRLYVADVSGDWREELIVLNRNQLRIYRNLEPNPDPGHPSLWARPEYGRAKMTWNYYNP